MSDIYITQREFKIEFGLTEEYEIPKATIKEYISLVKNLYKLHKDIEGLAGKKFKIKHDGKFVELVVGARLKGFSALVGKYTSEDTAFELSYIDSGRGPTPFWTYTKFENPRLVAKIAYNHFINNQLADVINKHGKKGLSINYHNGLGDYFHPLSNTIKIKGIDFIQTLRIRKPDGTLTTLDSYAIKRNIQDSNMARRIINSIDK